MVSVDLDRELRDTRAALIFILVVVVAVYLVHFLVRNTISETVTEAFLGAYVFVLAGRIVRVNRRLKKLSLVDRN